MFHGDWSSASGDITYLACHVTLQNQVVDGLSDAMSGSTAWYITTLTSLVVIGIVVLEI